MLKKPICAPRAGLERLFRYVLHELKTAWHDGTRELVFEPLEFLERLRAMPPPDPKEDPLPQEVCPWDIPWGHDPSGVLILSLALSPRYPHRIIQPIPARHVFSRPASAFIHAPGI